MQEKKIPVVSIIFYVLAAILLAYSIWALSFSINYVSTAVAQNQLIIDGYEFEVASFYMSNVAQYMVFAAILFGIGWVVQKIEVLRTECFELDDDDMFDDEWLEEVEAEIEEEIKKEDLEAEIREE
jgi:prepilin signal peptidase PulO-like enzyme (type II secretory pathway)